MSEPTSNGEPQLTADPASIKIYRKPGCRIEIDVKTSPKIVEQARKNALKWVGKEISFPGFRKGRAPEEMVIKKYGPEVEKRIPKEIADIAFPLAQKEAKIPLLNHSAPVSFEMKNRSFEEGAHLLFSFETEPEIPSIDLDGFKPVQRVNRPEVGDKEIEEAIRQMRFFYARWNSISDRAIQDGDYILIDLDTIEGEKTEKVFSQVRFEVSKERMASWMKKLVEGAKKGDVLDGVSEPEEGASEAEKNEFKPKKVRLSILNVEEAVLPEIDEEFAKKVGASDIAHMRQSIGDLLNKQADQKVENDLRDQANEYLLSNYSFDLPQSLVDEEKKHRLLQLAKNPKWKGDWEKMSDSQKKGFEENLASESAQAVSLYYLSRKIVQTGKISVTHQEVQNEAVSIYQSHHWNHVQIDQIPKEVYALALSKVILAKAQERLMKKA